MDEFDPLKSDPVLKEVPLDGDTPLLDRRYELEITLGRGGMGVVYRAKHRIIGTHVAIKVLDPAVARGAPQSVERFHREATAAEKLDGENIIRVRDVSEAHGLHYIVMEFVDGEDARARVQRKGPLAVDEALTIVHRAARGLAVAHAAGMIHRDVKPGNILISRTGQVKLADLGLAKDPDLDMSLSISHHAMGTPRYMPPEQFSDAKNVGPTADVYSLGATFYFLLTGRDGFPAESLVEALDHARSTPFPDPRELRPEIPAALAEFIERCTRKDPAQRPRNGAELVAALEAAGALQGGPLEDTEAGATSSRRQEGVVSPPPDGGKPVATLKVTIDDDAMPVSDPDESVDPAPVAGPSFFGRAWSVAAFLVMASVVLWNANEYFSGDTPQGPDPDPNKKTVPVGVLLKDGQAIGVPATKVATLPYEWVEPAPGAAVGGGPVRFAVRVPGFEEGTVLIGDRRATLTAGLWRASFPLEVEGENSVDLLISPEGKPSQATRFLVTRDTQPPGAPMVDLRGRGPFEAGSIESIELTFPGAEGRVRVEDPHGKALGLLENGSGPIQLTMPMHSGPAIETLDLEIVARDAVGNAQTHSVPLPILPRPRIRLDQPAVTDGAIWLNTRTFQVQGQVERPRSSSVQLKVAGVDIGAPLPLDSEGRFDAEVTLPTLLVRPPELHSVDCVPLTIPVRLDEAAPFLEVLEPSAALQRFSGPFDLHLRFTDTALAGYWISESFFAVEEAQLLKPLDQIGEPDAPIVRTHRGLELAEEGLNFLTVRAVDRAGNESKVNVAVVLDTQAPSILTQAPVHNSLVDSNQIDVSLTFDEAMEWVECGGVQFDLDPEALVASGSAKAGAALGDPQGLVLIWKGRDVAGNETQGLLTFRKPL